MSFVFLFLLFSDFLVCADHDENTKAKAYFSKEILKRYNQGYDSFSVKNNFFWQYCLKDRREATCFFFLSTAASGIFAIPNCHSKLFFKKNISRKMNISIFLAAGGFFCSNYFYYMFKSQESEKPSFFYFVPSLKSLIKFVPFDQAEGKKKYYKHYQKLQKLDSLINIWFLYDYVSDFESFKHFLVLNGCGFFHLRSFVRDAMERTETPRGQVTFLKTFFGFFKESAICIDSVFINDFFLLLNMRNLLRDNSFQNSNSFQEVNIFQIDFMLVILAYVYSQNDEIKDVFIRKLEALKIGEDARKCKITSSSIATVLFPLIPNDLFKYDFLRHVVMNFFIDQYNKNPQYIKQSDEERKKTFIECFKTVKKEDLIYINDKSESLLGEMLSFEFEGKGLIEMLINDIKEADKKLREETHKAICDAIANNDFEALYGVLEVEDGVEKIGKHANCILPFCWNKQVCQGEAVKNKINLGKSDIEKKHKAMTAMIDQLVLNLDNFASNKIKLFSGKGIVGVVEDDILIKKNDGKYIRISYQREGDTISDSNELNDLPAGSQFY